MRVVESMMSERAPIYTVHDNFISNAYSSMFLPNIYLQVIKEMGPPLKIINEFVLDNLLGDLSDDDLKPVQLKRDIRHKTQFVLPEDDLEKIIKVKRDKIKLTKSEDKIWENKKNLLMATYRHYCNIVTGGSYRYKDHVKMWNEYKDKLNGDYCLHS